MRKQKPDTSVEEFLQGLYQLDKDCDFRDVTVAKYKQDLIRDATISELMSRHIRQRLIENNQLTLEK